MSLGGKYYFNFVPERPTRTWAILKTRVLICAPHLQRAVTGSRSVWLNACSVFACSYRVHGCYQSSFWLPPSANPLCMYVYCIDEENTYTHLDIPPTLYSGLGTIRGLIPLTEGTRRVLVYMCIYTYV